MKGPIWPSSPGGKCKQTFLRRSAPAEKVRSGPTSESQLWKGLTRHPWFKERGRRLETRLKDGLPDVVVSLGGGRAIWLELKVDRVRIDEDGVVAPTLKLEQAIFLSRWRATGGLAGVLVAARGQLAYVNRDFRALRVGPVPAVWTGPWGDDLDPLIGVFETDG